MESTQWHSKISIWSRGADTLSVCVCVAAESGYSPFNYRTHDQIHMNFIFPYFFSSFDSLEGSAHVSEVCEHSVAYENSFTHSTLHMPAIQNLTL